MRVWDIDPSLLCDDHLGGEHREIHAIYNILMLGHKGYSQHPETKRWIGKIDALVKRHDMVVAERSKPGRRKWTHKSPLAPVGDRDYQDEYVNTIEEQFSWIQSKGCDCTIPERKQWK
jgi:hypothetical protein